MSTALEPAQVPGSIITFYSFKGGTGRSMALANVGCLLAQRQAQVAGKGVLLVDWDLEAPGLHRFFRNRFRGSVAAYDNGAEAINLQPGLIDLFLKLHKLVEDLPHLPELTPEAEHRLQQSLELRDFVLATDIGSLHLLKAGSFDDHYRKKVNTFGWEALYNRAPWLFPWFATWLAQKYQYVLIDSRTGVTDTSGICTMLLPEKLVVVFTPNLQSTEGALDQIEWATNYRRRSDDLRPLVVYPLPSRIEIDLKTQQEYWRFDPSCGYQPRLERLFERVYRLEKCDLTDYFNKVQVPQVRDYAYGEEIAVLVERGAETFSLTSAFTEFTSRLLAPEEPWAPPASQGRSVSQDDALRRAYAVIARLSPGELPFAVNILTRLVRVAQRPEDGGDSARPAHRDDIGGALAPIMEKLIASGLLRTFQHSGEPYLELAEPSLVAEWRQLKKWVDDDREFLLWRQRLDDALVRWRSEGRTSDLLLRGVLLQRALELIPERKLDFNAAELDFVNQSERRRRLRLVNVVAGVVTVTLGAMFLAWCLQKQASVSGELSRDRARATLAATLVADRPTDAALVLLEVRQPDSTPAASESLQKTLMVPVQFAALTGHAAEVWAASFSPDGTRVVTASRDKTARIWNAATGQLITSLTGHSDVVWGASFSPDGSRVVTASQDKTARIWNAANGQPIATLTGHMDGVWVASFSPDGSRVVTASQDKTARIWNAANGQPIATLTGHMNGVWVASFSPDSTRVVTASQDKTARIWNATNGQLIVTLPGHTAGVGAASFSPDGTRVVTASGDQTARIWNAANGQLIATLRGHTSWVGDASFSPDGAQVVTASDDQTARIWNAANGQPTATLTGHTAEVGAASFSPDGTRVVTASGDQTARVWNAANGQPIATLTGHTGGVVEASFSPDGTRVVTAAEDKTAQIWNATYGQPIATLTGHEVLDASFSPDGARIVTASRDNTAQIWNATTGQPIATLRHTDMVLTASFSPEGTRVVTASADNSTRIWNAATGQQITILPGLKQIESASFSPDGTRVVTASADRSARIWNAATGQQTATLLGHTFRVESASFSPDGTRIVTASADKTARIWNAATGQLIATLMGHTDGVMAASFSPDGIRVVTASQDHTARIWNSTTGQTIATLIGHTDGVMAASFSPDGTRVVTASQDHTARIWNATTGQPIITLTGHTDVLWAASFSLDGTRVVTASSDQTARIWASAGEYLQSRTRARTQLCIRAEFRQATLGESAREAETHEKRCNACVPRFFSRLKGVPSGDWQTYMAAWKEYKGCLDALR